MKDNKFKLNSRIDVLIDEIAYRSTIQDITDKYMAIRLPAREGSYVTPNNGDCFEAMYYEGLNVYKFDAVVIGRLVEEKVPLILLEIPKEVKKIQRREFVRVGVTEYIQYITLNEELISQEVLGELNEEKAKKGILLDISGGGIRLKVYEDVKLGDTIIADIPNSVNNIRIKGQVMRLEEDEEDKGNICGVCFVEIDNRSREKIIQLIFNIMRKQRKTT
jgi:c-di-GMP-binding flagellar brake protein YcgR